MFFVPEKKNKKTKKLDLLVVAKTYKKSIKFYILQIINIQKKNQIKREMRSMICKHHDNQHSESERMKINKKKVNKLNKYLDELATHALF